VTQVFPGFLDAHVHLALIDPAGLADGGIGRVLDLGGWTPGAAKPAGHGSPADEPAAGPDVRFAGQFLGAPGGYPSRQAWAPAGSSCPVASPGEAAAAVHRQAKAGAAVIKVTLNAAAGPVLDRETLAAIVAAAHERMLPVAAHTEGPGQAAAALDAGVDLLAHTPFSERLSDELIDAMARRMTWISTLDIHGWGEPTAAFSVASDNLARFHAAGGRVLYGTDLGNGPLPVGLNRREIAALLACGLSPDDVLTALTADFPGFPAESGEFGALARSTRPDTSARVDTHPAGPARVTVVVGDRPTDPHDLAGFIDWLLGARSPSARSLPHPDVEDLRS
jgi:imidazolonepropionase-like amidohydrolase